MWKQFLAQFSAGDNTRTLKAAGFVALCLLGVLVILKTLTGGNMWGGGSGMYEESMGVSAIPNMPMGAPAYERDEYGYDAKLSTRNVMSDPMPPQPGGGYTTGDDAESYEVKSYTASIVTRSLTDTCGAIESLKARTDVIFEGSDRYDRGCSHVFKVTQASTPEVYDIIRALNPKDLSEQTYTIKRQVDDYTSEVAIYQSKLATLDQTLAEALASYENVTALATKTGDTESLAKIIDQKLMLIERLTNARIDTQNQLDRIARAKADALDQLAYTHFSVTVTEETYIDGEALVDSWKQAAQQLVWSVNQFTQDISLGLIALIFTILKIALYGTILLVVAKVGWKFVRQVWHA